MRAPTHLLMSTFSMLLLTSLALGCGPSLSAAGAKVKVVDQAPTDCKSLGLVRSKSAGGHTAEDNAKTARIEIRNQAAELGGDYVAIESEEDKGLTVQIDGRAYQCGGGS